MNTNSYIAVVGPSFSGKSTLVHDLTNLPTKPVNVVEEYCVYAGGNQNFRTIPFASQKDAKRNIHDFLEWEKQRCEQAQRLHQSNGLPVVFDRSIYCVLLTQLLLRDKYPQLYNSFTYSFEQIELAVAQGAIVLPGRIVVVSPRNDATFASRTRRGVSVKAFASLEVMHYFRGIYIGIMDKSYVGQGRRGGIHITSHNEGQEQVVAEFLHFLQNSTPVDTTNILSNFPE